MQQYNKKKKIYVNKAYYFVKKKCTCNFVNINKYFHTLKCHIDLQLGLQNSSTLIYE